MNRRDVLEGLAALPVAAVGGTLLSGEGIRLSRHSQRSATLPDDLRTPVQPVKDQPCNFDPAGIRLLEDIRSRGAQFFLEHGDSATGLLPDRLRVDGAPDPRPPAPASIAATGFALSALCVAAQHGYLEETQCERRILITLDFLLNKAQHQRGFFPHYLDQRTGAAAKDSEYSSIDTALLLAGALHAGSLLNSAKAETLSRALYERVDWPWMLGAPQKNGAPSATLCMGWTPQSGFLKERWDSYSECLLMYLLAIGSPTHSIHPAVWDLIQRNTTDFGGIRFVSSYGALFIHQYLHCWADVRDLHDQYTNYFENSISAVRAHKAWCMLQHGHYPWIDERIWGFSACDTPRLTYFAWAAPPPLGEWDGTVSPHAAGGALPLMPEESIVVLKTMRERFPRSFDHYGFVNAFNPGANRGAGWFDPYIIASDLGLIMLMAENQQTGTVRQTFNKHKSVVRAMHAVGLRKTITT